MMMKTDDDDCKQAHTQIRKLSYRKDDRAMRPIYECPKKISGVPDYAHGYFSQNF